MVPFYFQYRPDIGFNRGGGAYNAPPRSLWLGKSVGSERVKVKSVINPGVQYCVDVLQLSANRNIETIESLIKLVDTVQLTTWHIANRILHFAQGYNDDAFVK